MSDLEQEVVHKEPKYTTKWFFQEWGFSWTVWSFGAKIKRVGWSYDELYLYWGPFTWVFLGERNYARD